MQLSEEDMQRFRVEETVDYICSRGRQVVTLQFPDALLGEAGRVAVAVQAGCRARGHEPQTYILADTTYNSLSVDEVAAAHVGADCVVHYGRASLTKVSRLPAFFVFPQQQLDVHAAAASVAGCSNVTSAAGSVVVFVDQPYLHEQEQLESALREAAPHVHWVFARVPARHLEPEQLAGEQRASLGCCQHNLADTSRANFEQAAAPQCSSGTACASQQPEQPHRAEPKQQAAAVGGALGDANSAPRSMACSQAAASSHSAAGYCWSLPSSTDPVGDPACYVWVGSSEAPALGELQLTRSAALWAVFDTDAAEGAGALAEGVPAAVRRLLRRRYFLVEKARQANIVGILVGTLGVAGYRQAIDALREAARRAGKKTYTLLVGKPSPAKLANFPEVEVFVMVADPQGQVMDSKEYLAPIITPHEAILAFSPEAEWDETKYRLDFEGLLAQVVAGGGDVASSAGSSDPGNALALQAAEALHVTPAPQGRSDLVQARSAADYLTHKRTWQGVESPLVGAAYKAVEAAAPGQSGRAAAYAGEPGAAVEDAER